MKDIAKKLAKVLVNYSLNVQEGWRVAVNTTPLAEPLVKEIIKEILKTGAHPKTNIHLDSCTPVFIKNANDKQLSYVHETSLLEAKTLDARIGINATSDTRLLSKVDTKKISMFYKSTEEIRDITLKRSADGDFHWVGTLWPTEAFAKEAEMSYEDFFNFVYKAGNLHLDDPSVFWKKFEVEQDKLASILNKGKRLRVLSKETDLKMEIEGRKWIPCSGKLNFPDGEVFTAPVEGSVEGRVRYRWPTVYQGVLVQDINLIFKNGEVADASAKIGEEHLLSLINLDKGAKVPGEVAIGTNYSIDRHIKNILFDEKIGGTFHMALGKGYPESGSKNNSALHWDMILDLREEGKILLDDEVIQEKGKFTDPDLNFEKIFKK